MVAFRLVYFNISCFCAFSLNCCVSVEALCWHCVYTFTNIYKLNLNKSHEKEN